MTVEVQLWDPPMTVQATVIGDALQASFRDARNETGSGTLVLPHTSANLAYFTTPYRVVKHVDDGRELFAWVVEDVRPTVTDDAPTITVSGRGILSWLEAGTVYPARGWRRRSKTDRQFGFGANDVFDGALGATFAPSQLVSTTAIPPGWPATTVERIWPTNPNGPTAAGTEAWFIRGIVPPAGRYRIDITGDDMCEVWLDGEKIIDFDGRDYINVGTTQSRTWRGLLSGDTHWLAVKGRQIDVVDLADLGIDPIPANTGPAWVALRLASITSDTDAGSTYLVTGTDWDSTLQQPGWTPAFTLRLMIDEAVFRGVDRVYWTSYAFGHETDEFGAQFPHNVNRSWPVGTDLLKLATDLVESGVDVWATPDKALHMAVQRGQDKTETVRLFPGGNLTAYGLIRRYRVRTAALVNTGDGWAEITDPDGVAQYGRVETRIDATAIDSIVQAANFAAGVLAPLAHPSLETDGDQTTLIPENVIPYRDFGVADVISVPDFGGGYTTATVQAISWRKGDPDQWALELDLAQQGARRASQSTTQRVLTVAQQGGAASAGGTIQSATK
jgi:hypothetical protein